MSTRTSPWPHGVPCWVDLMVPDVREASRFYEAVLGWTVPEPSDEWGGYVVAEVGGAACAGLGPQEPGARTAWTTYLATDDADAVAARIEQAGGTVLRAPFDVGPLGRMAIAADPTGATFGLWQAGTMIGASLVNEPGGLTWEDLRSTGPAAAQAFYTEVFGYVLGDVPMAPDDYKTFALPGDDAPLGGLGGLMGLPDGTPSHWLAYFAVADTDAAVRAVEAGGGTVHAPAFDSPFGRMAAVSDPYGAAFMVMQNTGQPLPDRTG